VGLNFAAASQNLSPSAVKFKRMKKISPVSRSGRFARGSGADVVQFTESVSFDWRLWRHDILGSLAHAAMLRKIGVPTKKELRASMQGLDAIGKENKAGQAVPPGGTGLQTITLYFYLGVLGLRISACSFPFPPDPGSHSTVNWKKSWWRTMLKSGVSFT
jgi:hypothetical protein